MTRKKRRNVYTQLDSLIQAQSPGAKRARAMRSADRSRDFQYQEARRHARTVQAGGMPPAGSMSPRMLAAKRRYR